MWLDALHALLKMAIGAYNKLVPVCSEHKNWWVCEDCLIMAQINLKVLSMPLFAQDKLN